MNDILPGFRFYPTEEELVSFYLHNKLNATRTDIDRVIPVVDIYDYNPWELPQIARDMGCPADSEQWFFFIPRQEREARGGRPNRLTTEGYWKATGSPADVYSSNNCVIIGRKRTMVFYVGRAPNGTKTIWKMNEYKAIQSHIQERPSSSSNAAANPQLREELSLCRIYRRSRSSLWAFERRPPAVRGDQLAAAHHHHDGGAPSDAATTFNYNQHMINIIPEITDHSSISHSTTNVPNSRLSAEDDDIHPCLASDGEPCWDSEQLNWFDM